MLIILISILIILSFSLAQYIQEPRLKIYWVTVGIYWIINFLKNL